MSRDEDATPLIEHRLLLRRCAWAVITLSATLLSGCNQTTPSTAGQPDTTPNPSLDGSGGHRDVGSSEQPETLMARAQQDVEFFLNQRDQRASSNNSQADGAAQQPDFYGDTTNDQGLSTTNPRRLTSGQPANGQSGQAPGIKWSDPVGALPDRPAGSGRDAEPSANRQTPPGPAPAEQTSERSATANPPVVQKPLAREEQRSAGNDSRAQQDQRQESAAERSESSRLNQLIVDLSGELYRHAERSDAPLRELSLIAATSLVSPDRKLHVQGIAGLSERDRELLADLQQFFADLGTKLDNGESNEDVLRASVEQLKTTLDRTPPFSIGTTTLCTRVRGFGDYDEFGKMRFLAHSQQRVIVYIEVEHFTSELNKKNEWVTELSQELVIYSDRDGIPVWSETWQSVVDVTRNKRQDFFTVQLVTLPKALSVGRYSLKVRMRDEKTGAVAEQSIPFEMVADPRLAASVR